MQTGLKASVIVWLSVRLGEARLWMQGGVFNVEEAGGVTGKNKGSSEVNVLERGQGGWS